MLLIQKPTVTLRAVTLRGDTIITFDPQLPCVRVGADNALCGNPTNVANAALVDGRYLLRPWCTQCASEMAIAHGLISAENPHNTPRDT